METFRRQQFFAVSVHIDNFIRRYTEAWPGKHAMTGACQGNTRAVRLTEEGECFEEYFRPSSECLEEGLRCLLKTIWTEEHRAAHKDDVDFDEEELEETEEAPKEDQTESETPLEDLGLSARSFNCLKRAGISSVEQLIKRRPMN